MEGIFSFAYRGVIRVPDLSVWPMEKRAWVRCYGSHMTITVELPDDVATHENAGREALEALAIEGYRSGQLTQRQAAAMLDLYWLEFEGLLKARGVTEGAYSEDDLRRDIEAGDRLRASGLLPS